jgi:poly-gamma-glutamate synthesis protein (capsule biosynthesis protein)
MGTVLIGADVSPRARTLAPFVAGDAQAIFNDLLPEFEAADVAVVNLECPLVRQAAPVEEPGVILGAPLECIETLRRAHIKAVNLANNHILDQQEAGVESTLAACAAAGIAAVGAGQGRESAGRVRVFESGGSRVGLLGMAEDGFWTAGRDSWGANPADAAHFVRTLKRHRGAYDCLIVLLHGGAEHYPYPTPRLMDACRFMIEEGAGAVVCQHSHCAGCWEAYQGGFIVYGQGNLLFDRYPDAGPSWYEGFLVRLRVEAGRVDALDLVPYTQCGATVGARRMGPAAAERMVAEIERRCRAIQEPGFVEREWRGFCDRVADAYLSYLHGHGPWRRRLNKRLHWLQKVYRGDRRRVLLGFLRCETTMEILRTILR